MRDAVDITIANLVAVAFVVVCFAGVIGYFIGWLSALLVRATMSREAHHRRS